MGFPVGYSELLLPKLLLQFVFFLAFLRQIISTVFDAVGLGDLLESDAPWPDLPAGGHRSPDPHSFSADLIQEILPVVRFEELVAEEGEIGRRPVVGACAVCLDEIEIWEEVRRLSNCRHVFHRCCLDRWIQHDQRICPLCRTLLVPEEMREAFNRRVLAAGGVAEFDAADFRDYSPAILSPTTM